MRGRRLTKEERDERARELKQARSGSPLEKAARAAHAAFVDPDADPYSWEKDVTPQIREKWRRIAQAALDAHAKETRERQNVRDACDRLDERLAQKRAGVRYWTGASPTSEAGA